MTFIWSSLIDFFSTFLQDFEEFPEHRTNFFLLLQAVNLYCFNSFLSIPATQFKLVLDSIIWAFKHTMRNVADTGLNILFQLLQNVSGNPEAAQSFYQTYYTDILQHMFSVVTDTSHTAGLTMHATILAYVFALVESGKVNISFCFGKYSYFLSNRFVQFYIVSACPFNNFFLFNV